MDTMLQNFHFLRPWFLLLILPVLFMYGRYLKSGSTKSSWQKVIDKKLLNFLLIKGSSQRRNFYSIATILGMMAAIIAVSGPSFQKIEVPALTPQNPVMIALNLSSDMQETDLAPNRLSRAKYKIADFLSMLQGVQTGLEVYSGEPFVISPLSDDANIIKNLLPAIDLSLMPTNGDRLDRAIDLAINKIKSASYDKGHIIVFTPDVGQGFDKALASAEKAKQQGFIIDIIGVTAKYNEKLALVAEKGGGKYWNLQADDTRISQLASAINRTGGELVQGQNLRTIWLDAGWYLLAVPMLCCLLFFRKGLLLWLLIASFDAKAGFFLNSDQEGIKSFNNGEYTAAAEQFNDNQWKAASFYRMGDFAKAAEAAGADAVSLINTITGMAINAETRRPRIANLTGGLSGPAIKPVALRMVYEASKAVKIPVIGMGGICNGIDAVEFMLAGARAVAVGTAIFADPYAPLKVIEGIQDYLERHNIKSVSEIVGALEI